MDEYGSIRGVNGSAKEEKMNYQANVPTRTLLSRILFRFVQPLVTLSTRQKLQLDDIWPLDTALSSENASHDFRLAYAKTQSLIVSIWRTEWKDIGISSLLGLLSVVTFALVPLFLFRLLTLVMVQPTAQRATMQILLLLFGLLCGTLLTVVLGRHAEFRMLRVQIRVVAAIRSLLFEKSMERPQQITKRRGRLTAIATISSTNIVHVSWLIIRLHHAWIAASKLLILLFLIHYTLEVDASVIIVSLTPISLVMLVLTIATVKLNQECTKKREKTLNKLNACFQGIQAVKMHAWEKKMHTKIMRQRMKEEVKQKWLLGLRTLRFCAIWKAPSLASVAIFYSLAISSINFSPATAFTSMVLFQRIQTEFEELIFGCRVLVEGSNGLRKIRRYLNQCEASVQSNILMEDRDQRYPPNTVVAIDHAFLCEGRDPLDFVLTNVNVTASVGELVVVYGKAGAGKSTLLTSLLGEVVPVRGQVYVSGKYKVAYCSQDPWLQTLSVKENILFGSEYDETKYYRVLEACCLFDDLNALPDGEDTMIGPKGVNLSGGQQSRIALARTFYTDADLFILDCPLANVDAIVQSDLFRKGLLELLRHKTVIMATHNPEIISSEFVDRLWEVDSMTVTETSRNTSLKSEDYGKHASSRRVRQLADIPPWRTHAAFPISGSSTSIVDAVHRQSLLSVSSTSDFKRIIRLSSVPDILKADDTVRQMQTLLIRVAKDMLWENERWHLTILSFLLLIIFGGFTLFGGFYLAYWSDLPYSVDTVQHAAFVYAFFVGGAFVTLFASMLVLVFSVSQCASVYFSDMTKALLHAPMAFFYRTPIGEILVRYSTDIQVTDLMISFRFSSALHGIVSIFGSVITIFYFLGIAGVLIGLLTFYICKQVVRDRLFAQVFTLQNALDARHLNFVSEALDGSAVIRAFGSHQMQRFCQNHSRMLDHHSRVLFAIEAYQSWVLINYSVVFGAFFAILVVILAQGGLQASDLGLIIVCIFTIQHKVIDLSADLLTMTVQVGGIGRILEFQSIAAEDNGQSTSVLPTVVWPTKGEIVFDHVWFQYDNLSPFALKNVSMTIAAGEKIGVVGRTGSGKSSLAIALFRVHELSRGRILIDGMDICRLRLSDLRSRLCMIPQSPIFYRCSVRSYMDPFDEFDDATLWRVLRKSGLCDDQDGLQMTNRVHVSSLKKPLVENGVNWSVGERQLLVLARALLKPSRVVILDESFSSVDQECAERLLRVMATEFALSTIILITHRLDQVLGFDRIVVMQDGKVVECGKAEELVANPNSVFYEFLETTLLTY